MIYLIVYLDGTRKQVLGLDQVDEATGPDKPAKVYSFNKHNQSWQFIARIGH